jgi:hypothetical protein
MKLTVDVIRPLEVGESLLIDETPCGSVHGYSSCLFFRLKPKKFIQKQLLLVDPVAATAVKVWRITRTK